MAALPSDCHFHPIFDSLSQSDIELWRTLASYVITFLQAMCIGGVILEFVIVFTLTRRLGWFMLYGSKRHQKGISKQEDVETALREWGDALRALKETRAELMALRVELRETFRKVNEFILKSGAVGQMNESKEEEMKNTKGEKN